MVTLTHKPIVLLGFMGSGKSTLGKQIATSLGFTFIDLDRFIETEENRTIPDIFEKDGEAAFRRLESSALKKVVAHPQQVISIGGGAPCNPENLQLIREKSISVYLKISEAELLNRLISSSTRRPLLKGKSESETRSTIAAMMSIREPFYLQADIIIESDFITPTMILEILSKD